MIGTRAAVTAAILLVAARAAAQDKGAVADALFREGVTLFEAGRVREACEKFAESFRVDPANGTLQNLALCHEKEGKIATAWGEFAELAGRAADADQRERAQMARTHARQLEPRVAHVKITGAEVEKIAIDGKELARGAWSVPVPLDVGEHTIVFAAAHKKSATRVVRVERDGSTIGVEAPALEDEAVAPAAREPTRGTSGRRVAAIALGGAGIVALGIGTYFGLATISKKNDGDAHCVARFCDAQGLALQDDAHTDATISTIAFGAGILAVGAGAVLWFTAGDGAVRVGPSAGLRGVRAELSW